MISYLQHFGYFRERIPVFRSCKFWIKIFEEYRKCSLELFWVFQQRLRLCECFIYYTTPPVEEQIARVSKKKGSLILVRFLAPPIIIRFSLSFSSMASSLLYLFSLHLFSLSSLYLFSALFSLSLLFSLSFLALFSLSLLFSLSFLFSLSPFYVFFLFSLSLVFCIKL